MIVDSSEYYLGERERDSKQQWNIRKSGLIQLWVDSVALGASLILLQHAFPEPAPAAACPGTGLACLPPGRPFPADGGYRRLV